MFLVPINYNFVGKLIVLSKILKALRQVLTPNFFSCGLVHSLLLRLPERNVFLSHITHQP